jgi:hypothetical protein
MQHCDNLANTFFRFFSFSNFGSFFMGGALRARLGLERKGNHLL